jgi:two-component system cell cycle response regulator DivK
MTAGRVLVVEDQEHLLRIFCNLLQLFGYETITAETGKDALQKAAAGNPDLILMDLNLPDIAGDEVAKQIKKDPKLAGIPIIGCSAFSVGDEKDKALHAGMVEYLQKPISSSQLRENVGRFIRRPRP